MFCSGQQNLVMKSGTWMNDVQFFGSFWTLLSLWVSKIQIYLLMFVMKHLNLFHLWASSWTKYSKYLQLISVCSSSDKGTSYLKISAWIRKPALKNPSPTLSNTWSGEEWRSFKVSISVIRSMPSLRSLGVAPQKLHLACHAFPSLAFIILPSVVRFIKTLSSLFSYQFPFQSNKLASK